MSEKPRNWDRELAEIDRLISAQGGKPTPPVAPAGAAAPAKAGAARASAAAPRALPPPPRHTRMAWLASLVAVAAAVAMTQWPWAQACGPGLLAHVAASAGVILVGTWAALVSWKRHAGFPHVLALLTMLWGGVLIVLDVLPASSWRCG